MSIHLNGLEPLETAEGVAFSADVNGRRVDCLITTDALRSLNNCSGRDGSMEVFRATWPTIRDAAHHKIRSAGSGGSPSLRLGPEDFDLPELQLFNEREAIRA
jgi:Protein of unknown function (DUF1488)